VDLGDEEFRAKRIFTGFESKDWEIDRCEARAFPGLSLSSNLAEHLFGLLLASETGDEHE
jgi:hypothetical protein